MKFLNGSERINAGLIGCGKLATSVHLPAMMEIEGLKVKALSDVNEKNLTDAKRKFKVEYGYLDYKVMLKEADIDSVWICTPPETHEKIVLDCLKHGKHVLCEKPISQSLQGALEVKRLFEESSRKLRNLILMPAHNFIFTPNLQYSMNLILEGEIGNVKYIRSTSTSNLTFYGAKTDFRVRARGGVIEDQLPHTIYVCQSIAGNIERILSVKTSRSQHAYINSVHTVALTRRGVRLEMSAEWTRFMPKFKVEVFGTSGMIELDLLKSPYKVKISRGDEVETINLGKKSLQFLDTLRNRHPSYLMEDEHFCRCIRGLEEPRVSVDDGVALVRAVEEIMSFLGGGKTPIKKETVILQPAREKVNEAVEALFKTIELRGILKKSSLTLIKPNICYPKNPKKMVITDPELLKGVIEFVKPKTDRLIVVESDNNSGRAEVRAEKSGVMEVIEDCGVEFLNLSDVESEEIKVSGCRILIPKILREADFIINMPKLKTCSVEGITITIAMKNMFGILSNRKKSRLHKKLLDVLLYINRNVKQDLIIVDGIVAMEGLGPIWGSPVNLGLLIAGTNPVSVDSVCSYIMGINPYSIELLWKAYKEGMGEINVENIEVIGLKLEDVKTRFELPSITPRNLFKALKARFAL